MSRFLTLAASVGWLYGLVTFEPLVLMFFLFVFMVFADL